MATLQSTYSYSPLPSPTSTRLVEFIGAAQAGGIIRIALRTFDLSSIPPFQALSYTWGDPRCPHLDAGRETDYLETKHVIECGGQRFLVRRNLLDALKMLSTHSDIISPFVWIDAICIDQSNLQERSSQVQMMASIYGAAERVVGWLGPADDTTVSALSVVDRLSAVVPQHPRSFADFQHLARRFDAMQLTEADFFAPQSYGQKLGTQCITKADWLAWIALLYRPYFERAWIVQEVTLARRLVLVCGDRVILWETFATSCFFIMVVPLWMGLLSQEHIRSWLSPGSPEWPRFHRLAEPHGIVTFPLAAAGLAKLRAYSRGLVADDKSQTPTNHALRALLEDYRATVASDPRDKLFAFYALADHSKEPFLHPVATGVMVADYQLPVEAVYIRFARLMLLAYGSLRILKSRELDHVRKLKSLPSWVPDWSVMQFPQPMRETCARWEACGQEKWVPDGRSLDDALLSVQGRRVGTVEQVAMSGMDAPPATLVWGSMFSLLQGVPWQRFVDGRLLGANLAPIDNDDGRLDLESLPTRVEVLARTVARDVLGPQTPAPVDSLCNEFLAFTAEKCVRAIGLGSVRPAKGSAWNVKSWRSRLTGRPAWYEFAEDDRRLKPILEAFESEPGGSRFSFDALWARVEEQCNQVAVSGYAAHSSADPLMTACAQFKRQSELSLSCRVVFRTSGGLLLGTGPANTQPGDEVWVLSGADTPVILRPSSSSHRFLGDAYVYGMMNGQALKQFPTVYNLVLE